MKKKHYKPKLNPRVDLAGATPEALVRALFRRVEPLDTRSAGQLVKGDELSMHPATSPQPESKPHDLVPTRR